MIVVVGAGPAGIGAGSRLASLRVPALVVEARQRWGGLCDSFQVGAYRFDNAIHISFTKDPEMRALFHRSAGRVNEIGIKPLCYDRGIILKHPVQNNLYPLPSEFKARAIKSFRERPKDGAVRNYRDWLVASYGEVIADSYPEQYTRKYWTCPSDQLTTEWVGSRMHSSSLEEVLRGAETDQTKHAHYIDRVYYPWEGGFRSFFRQSAEACKISLGKKAARICPDKRIIWFEDGSEQGFEVLISTLPLPELIKLLPDVPAAVKQAADALIATSIGLVSIGLDAPERFPHGLLYIYDRDMLPARASAPIFKSPTNAPEGRGSVQFEIHFSRLKPLSVTGEQAIEHAIENLRAMGYLSSSSQVLAADFRIQPYANVVFDRNRTPARKIVLDYLESCGILTAGRFGRWDYLWSDDSYKSGMRAAEAAVARLGEKVP